MAKACAPKNIHVNAVVPGIIKTKLTEAVSILWWSCHFASLYCENKYTLLQELIYIKSLIFTI